MGLDMNCVAGWVGIDKPWGALGLDYSFQFFFSWHEGHVLADRIRRRVKGAFHCE